MMMIRSFVFVMLLSFHLSAKFLPAQQDPPVGGKSRAEEIELGSRTARGGFANEDEIRDKFNAWKNDRDAQAWLAAMNYSLEDVIEVKAEKPHGEKADVMVTVTSQTRGERREGISIKLVSIPDGFNQIDKRWLQTYIKAWEIPVPVQDALKKFVGETKPTIKTRDPRRMFFDEMEPETQQAVLEFFTANRERIAQYIFAGDGEHAAGWLMVTLRQPGEKPDPPKTDADQKPADNSSQSVPQTETREGQTRLGDETGTQSILVPIAEAARFFGEGPVEFTSNGNLRIGRITMQRKGGDNGRPSANKLQFKINPTELWKVPNESKN